MYRLTGQLVTCLLSINAVICHIVLGHCTVSCLVMHSAEHEMVACERAWPSMFGGFLAPQVGVHLEQGLARPDTLTNPAELKV